MQFVTTTDRGLRSPLVTDCMITDEGVGALSPVWTLPRGRAGDAGDGAATTVPLRESWPVRLAAERTPACARTRTLRGGVSSSVREVQWPASSTLPPPPPAPDHCPSSSRHPRDRVS